MLVESDLQEAVDIAPGGEVVVPILVPDMEAEPKSPGCQFDGGTVGFRMLGVADQVGQGGNWLFDVDLPES